MARSPASASKKTATKKPAPRKKPAAASANPKGSPAAVKDIAAGGAEAVSPEPDLTRTLDLVMQLMAIRGGSGDEKDVAAFVVHDKKTGDVLKRGRLGGVSKQSGME